MMENRHMAVRLPGQTRKDPFRVYHVSGVLNRHRGGGPQIFSSGNRLWALSLQYAPLMLCAMSQTACMLVGGINLALGTAMSLMTTVCAVTMGPGALGMAQGIVCTIGAGALVGLIMGAVVAYCRLPDIIVTLAFSYIWKGVALIVLPTPGGYVNPEFSGFLSKGGLFPPGHRHRGADARALEAV